MFALHPLVQKKIESINVDINKLFPDEDKNKKTTCPCVGISDSFAYCGKNLSDNFWKSNKIIKIFKCVWTTTKKYAY